MPKLPQFVWQNEGQTIDYSQEAIIKKVNEYLEWKKSLQVPNESAEDTPVITTQNIENGLCSGLSVYWLYAKRTGVEWEFIHRLQHLLFWDPDKLSNPNAKEDQIIEDFLNAIFLLNFSDVILPAVWQHNFHASFALIFGPNAERISKPEFTITLTFTKSILSDFLPNIIHPNKMIYINNAKHAIALMYANDKYYVYNNGFSDGAIETDNYDWVIDIIFAAFSADDLVNLHIGIFDLERPDLKALNARSYVIEHLNLLGQANMDKKLYNLQLTDEFSDKELQIESPVKYPDPEQVIQEALNIPGYAEHMIANPEVQSFLVRFNQYKTLEILASKGMQIAQNINAPHNAVQQYSIETLFWLLANGTSVYERHIPSGLTLLLLACVAENKPALALLFAFGYELGFDENDDLFEVHFNIQERNDIYRHAIDLRKKLLHVPDILNLDTASSRDVMMFLRTAKLRILSNNSLEEIKITFKHKEYFGLAALSKIADYYNASSNGDIYDFAERAEIYNLLKFFAEHKFKFSGSDKLLSLLKTLIKKITSKAFEEHSENDLIEIALIMDRLQEIIKTNPKSWSKQTLIKQAQVDIDKINAYFADVGIDSIQDYVKALQANRHQRNYLFFSPARDAQEEDISFNRDIAPLLRFN